MHEQTSQLRILAALSIVVIALAVGLFFFLPTNGLVDAFSPDEPPTGNVTPSTPPAHERVRDAEIGLEPTLSFTQTFGGSGDESVVDSFYDDENLYIFGNTTSSDLDFDSSGAFLAILDRFGKTVSFHTYEGKLKDVTLYEGGFVMAIDADSPRAVAVDYHGDELNSYAIPTVREETALDIQYADSCFLYITSLEQSITGHTRLKLTLLDSELKFISSVLTNETYSLEYVDTVDVMGEFRLIANAISDKSMVCMGAWGKKLAHYPLDISYRAIDFWINGDFYYLAHSSSGTSLIRADGKSLTLAPNQCDGQIVGDGEFLYISAGDAFYCSDGEKISFSAQYGRTSFYVDELIYAVSCGEKTTVRTFSGGKKLSEATFSVKMDGASAMACPLGLFVIGETNGKFGGKDITVAKVDDSFISYN